MTGTLYISLKAYLNKKRDPTLFDEISSWLRSKYMNELYL